MTYPYMNGTLAGNNVLYFFTYANSVTHELFGLFMVISFFIVVLLGSLFAQMRFTGRMKFEVSLLAASFSTLGFATIIEQYTGIFSPVYFFILIGVTILSFLWLATSSNE